MPFVNAWFLGLLPLAALPIIIHMIHRQKFPILDFSTLLFFDRSRKYNVFRLRLRHVLLMILRIAIVLLVVLAFSRFSFSGLGFGDKQQGVMLVLDGSYSMKRAFGNETLFEFAKKQALSGIDELEPGAAVGVVVNTAPPQVLALPTSEHEAVKKVIESLEQFYGRSSSWEAVDLAQNALENVRSSSREVVVLTDLQRESWSGQTLSQRESESSHSTIPIRFISLRPPTSGNVAIARVDVQQAPITIGRAARFSLVIRNFSEKPVKSLRIMAGTGPIEKNRDAPGESLQLEVPSNGTAKVNFYFTFSIPGHQEIWFQLADDALAADNEWVETVSVQDTLPVLLLGSKPVEDEKAPETDELFYLSIALSHAGRSGNISLVISDTGQLAKMGLYGYNCVFLASVKDLGDKEVNLIRQYVSRGGGLVIFPGQGTDEESLTRLFAADKSGSIMPVNVEGLVRESSRIAKADFHESVLGTSISSILSQQLKGISYKLHYRYSVREDSRQSTRTLAVFYDGTPAMIETRYGFGRCVLFAGGCGLPASDIQFRAIFPTLMQALALQLAQPVRSRSNDVGPGEYFVAWFEEAEQPKKLRVTGPGDSSHSVEIRVGESEYSMAFNRTDLPGGFQVRAVFEEDEEAETIVEAFAVNTGDEDSNLRSASADEIKKVLPDAVVSLTLLNTPDLLSDLLVTDRRELMRILLILVLGIVVVENILSWITK